MKQAKSKMDLIRIGSIRSDIDLIKEHSERQDYKINQVYKMFMNGVVDIHQLEAIKDIIKYQMECIDNAINIAKRF